MFETKKIRKTVYLDYAATTYVDPKVVSAMQPYFSKEFGNPSSLYALGRNGKQAVGDSREKIARILNCRPGEIIFTAGGTESVNMAIFGAVNYSYRQKGAAPHIITNKAEHHAVLRSFEELERRGVSCTYLDVDGEGFVAPEKIIAAIRPETVLVSVMYANNEIGTIQLIAEISKQIQKTNKEREIRGMPRILFHSDACQAAGCLDLNVQKLGVDFLSLNASKIYGPKQMGLLYKKSGASVAPLIFGGGQESGLRSGTENVAGIVGFARALEIAAEMKIKANKRERNLRNYFIEKALNTVDGLALNGPDIKIDSETSQRRLPNNINLSVDGVEGEALMLYLDAFNVSVSTGSACSTAEADPSHVLMAIGKTREQAASSIRITLGRKTSKRDLNYVLKVIPELVQVLRQTSKALS